MTTFGDMLYFNGGIPVSSGNLPFTPSGGRYWFVDGTSGVGSDGNSGKKPSEALSTIQQAITNAVSGDVVCVFPKKITDYTGDPTSYAETLIIPATKPHLTLAGVSHGLTQGGLPQVKIGAGAVATLDIRAAGCLIMNMGFNGAGSTGKGIILNDDNSTTTAFGTTITGCHFKNFAPSASLAASGGAINWTTAGNAWQVRIAGNRFYKNTADIHLPGTSNSVPQDVVIERNIFSGPAASVSCNILFAGSGMSGVIINDNIFPCTPAAGGTNLVVSLIGVGVFSNNRTMTNGATYGATGNGGVIPTGIAIAGNYQDGALIART